MTIHRTVIFMSSQAEYSQTAGTEDVSKQNRSIDFTYQPDFLRLCSIVMRNECYARDGPLTNANLIYVHVTQM